MRGALFPDVREQPVAAGMVWAAMTFVLMILFGPFFGYPVTPRQMVILALVMPFGGLAWGYCTRWLMNRVTPNAR